MNGKFFHKDKIPQRNFFCKVFKRSNLKLQLAKLFGEINLILNNFVGWFSIWVWLAFVWQELISQLHNRQRSFFVTNERRKQFWNIFYANFFQGKFTNYFWYLKSKKKKKKSSTKRWKKGQQRIEMFYERV